MPKSQNESKKHALIPSAGELVLFPVLAFIILCLLGYERIMTHYGIQISSYDLSDSIITFQDRLSESILPNLATALVWALIGLGVYLAVWLFLDSGNRAIKATSKAQRFVYPSRESRHVFAVTILGQLAVRVVAVLALAVWVLALAGVASWLTNFFYSLATFDSLADVVLGVIALAMFAFYLFVGAPIMRLIFLRPRVLSDQ
jgi:hypothetical protein